jgi:hypothetical protein
MRSADDSKPINGPPGAGVGNDESATTAVRLNTDEPTERHLMTVIRSRRGEDHVPHICMSGKWLARAGFASGSRIAVAATAGQLVITVVSPPGPMRAQEIHEVPPWSWKPAKRLNIKHGYSWES